mmetsp:Transcript_21531/g.38359  ORF Transcript_21531/g.38359 Transcript_21531/m.38359 type:complete len:209 (-) Transcript_21531:114-740(-)
MSSMDDPGRRFLYSAPPSTADHPRPNATGKEPVLPETLTTPTPEAGNGAISHTSAGGASGTGNNGLGNDNTVRRGMGRWNTALGNVADAGVALQQLKHALDDAVYLDEDAYNGVASLSHYTRTIQAQQRRILELEHELEVALGSVERAESTARESERRRREAETRASSIEAELENNAVVFKMHYNELLAKSEEVQKLKAIIEGLSGQR